MDRRFADVQQAAAADRSLQGRVRPLSVSFDPDVDTPAVWRFATAKRDIVDRFAAAFGVSVIREGDTSITHNLRTTVIDPAGRVVSVYDGSAWTPPQIVEDLRKAIATR